MKTFKLLLVVIVSFALFSCATSGPKFSEMQSSFPELTIGKGRIYLYRVVVMGAAVQPKVYINGEEVGKAVPKGFFYVDREPGNYEIATSTEVKRKLSLTLDENQIRYVRLNISFGFFVGHVFPELVENEVGESEIQNCRYIGKEL
jgi:hypothetical protein